MSANLYCWEPALGLDPRGPDFAARHRTVQNSREQPTQRLLDFAAALLSRYPDLTETEDTVWATGPLLGEISGGHISVAVMWSAFDAVVPFVVTTAHAHGLHCYDPQDGKFHPFDRTSLNDAGAGAP